VNIQQIKFVLIFLYMCQTETLSIDVYPKGRPVSRQNVHSCY